MRMCNLGQMLFDDYSTSDNPHARRAWERHKRGCGECGGNRTTYRVLSKRVLPDGRTVMEVVR
jgi:hypothetical protein